ncbi:MAG: CPBP family intramembrane metalloprotease [Anaerolineae bacterium]|nr:CPBP family intramembrane metalloprotease [Anaerolineae bacterium]
MDFFSFLMFGGVITYVGFTIYLANQETIVANRQGLLRWLLYGLALMTFLYGTFILQAALVPLPAEVDFPQIDSTAGAVYFVLTTAVSLLSIQIISSQTLRERIRRRLPASAAYQPDSPVHTTALVLILAFICVVVGNFVVGGGLAGLAESIQLNGVNLGDILFQNVLWVAAAALGVGLLLRRAPDGALKRLGLRLPTRQDISWGVGIGVLLFGVIVIVSMVWTSLVTPEELQQQTAASGQLAQAFNSLPKALALSVMVAIGEEVFFRGAIQPVLGIWVTSAFFVLLHTQYTLTPATVMIFITSVALGWLRERLSTSASIIAHFVYNFIQLALAVLVGSSL